MSLEERTAKAIETARLYPLRFLARIALEIETPLHIGSGREWGASDAGVVLDANGLPAIPGATIAGVLRSGLENDGASSLFGWQGPAGRESPSGQGSRLSVSWGCIHDKFDTPVYGLVEESRLRDDEILRQALCGSVRDHVRINDRGVADTSGWGKFDETVVCAGHRFTFEIELIGQQQDRLWWDALLQDLHSPLTRFGGRTRRGLGRFKLVGQWTRCLDLNSPGDLADYLDYAGRLDEKLAGNSGWRETPKDELQEAKAGGGQLLSWQLHLQAESFWLFGAGSDDEADMAPVRESRIVWKGAGAAETGSVETGCFVIPGSAVKGALSHRTLFHARAIAQAYAGQATWAQEGQAQGWHKQIYGTKKSKDSPDGPRMERAMAGRLYIDDLVLSSTGIGGADEQPASRFQQHVAIDAFAGGSLESKLFNERPLYGGGLCLQCWLADPAKVERNAQLALRRAFDDLCAGRLQLGGGAGRGRGHFKGNPKAIPLGDVTS